MVGLAYCSIVPVNFNLPATGLVLLNPLVLVVFPRLVNSIVKLAFAASLGIDILKSPPKSSLLNSIGNLCSTRSAPIYTMSALIVSGNKSLLKSSSSFRPVSSTLRDTVIDTVSWLEDDGEFTDLGWMFSAGVFCLCEPWLLSLAGLVRALFSLAFGFWSLAVGS